MECHKPLTFRFVMGCHGHFRKVESSSYFSRIVRELPGISPWMTNHDLGNGTFGEILWMKNDGLYHGIPSFGTVFPTVLPPWICIMDIHLQ